VNSPRRDGAGRQPAIKSFFQFGKPVERACAAAGKDMRIVDEPRLGVDDVQRDLWQYQRPGVILFTRLFRNDPFRAIEVGPFHCRHLGAALRRQQR
jgi:hypothetical protein